MLTRLPTPSPGAQAEALIEEARQRRRRRWLATGAVISASLLVVTAAVLAVVLGSPAHAPRDRLPASRSHLAAAPMPSQIVVWTDYFRIEVLSARTGRVIRTLATNVAEIRGLPDLTASASGTLFFDDVAGTHERILSVPLAGGPETAVAQHASEPAVSPDGRLLAYVANTDGSSAPEAIVVRDLVTGAERRWAFPWQGLDIAALSWSPNDRSLSFTEDSPAAGVFWVGAPSWVLDTSLPGGSLASARPIPLHGRLSWAGYLTARTGVAVLEGPNRTALFLVDVATGRVIRPLTSLPEELNAGNANIGPAETVQVDPTGRYLLISAAGPTGHGEVYRWTLGMRHPARIVSGVVKAIWAGVGQR